AGHGPPPLEILDQLFAAVRICLEVFVEALAHLGLCLWAKLAKGASRSPQLRLRLGTQLFKGLQVGEHAGTVLRAQGLPLLKVVANAGLLLRRERLEVGQPLSQRLFALLGKTLEAGRCVVVAALGTSQRAKKCQSQGGPMQDVRPHGPPSSRSSCATTSTSSGLSTPSTS